ncbi:MAG TPA: hypothetical protein VF855_12860 [Acidimicrobiales bacterium]
MATIIMGHGNRIEGEAKTFVPQGTSIKFFGEDRATLLTSNALAVVATGGAGTPTEEFGPGEEIWNYHLYKEDDRGIAQYMQLDPGGNTMVFVGPDLGNDTPLCTDVLMCEQHGEHSCDGVLGQYAGDLIVLACRPLKGAGDSYDPQLGGDEDDPTADLDAQLDEWKDGFYSRVQADPDAAEAEFDNLPYNTQVMLLTSSRIKAWSEVRYIRWYANQNDLVGFINQIDESSLPKDAVQRWLREVPAYGDSLYYLIVGRVGAIVQEALQEGSVDQDEVMRRLEADTNWIEGKLGEFDRDKLASTPGFREAIAQFAAAMGEDESGGEESDETP